MADSSSRSLLAAHGEPSKARGALVEKRGPYKTISLLLLLFATLVGCVAASVVILITSHEDRVNSWRVQPSIWLSLLAGVYAIGLGGLFVLGVAISWWRSMAHGTTLKRLHFISAGSNPMDFIPAFKAGGYARRVVLVAVLVYTTRLAVGPLLQRSTRPRNRDVARDVVMKIPMAEQIPDGWYGTWDHFDYPGIRVTQETMLNETITTSLAEGFLCEGNGTCSGSVPGAGFSYVCTNDNRKMDFFDRKNINTTLFSIAIDLVDSFEQPMLNLVTEYVETVDDACEATIRTDSCYIIPATVLYPIAIKNTTLTLDTLSYLSNQPIIKNYTSPADTEDKSNSSRPIGPLMGIHQGIGQMFRSKALLYRDNTRIGWYSTPEPHHSPQWPAIFADGDAKDHYPGTCPLVFTSPTQNILAHIAEYTFRSAYSSALETKIPPQPFTATFTGTELHHTTSFRFLAASVAVMLLGLAAATSLLWGWWQLSRYPTLSPLETGKAFGAPILLTAGPELEASGIIKRIGHERVANDGDELVWSGSVYSTSASAQGSLHGRDNSVPFPSTTTTGAGVSANRRVGNRSQHRRGPSYNLSADGEQHVSDRDSPAFQHQRGVSTKRWDDDDEDADVARYGNGRQRSGSGSGSGAGDRDSLLPLPLTLTPGKRGVPELPPIPRSEDIGMEIVGAVRRAQSPPVMMASPPMERAGEQDWGIPAPQPQLRRKMSLIDEIARRAPQ